MRRLPGTTHLAAACCLLALLLGCTPLPDASPPATASLQATPASATTARPAATPSRPPLPGVTFELAGQYGGLPRAVAVDGRYAYVGAGYHLIVVDVGDPTAPKVVAQSALLPGAVRGVAAAEGYVYVAAGPQLVVCRAAGGGAPEVLGAGLPLPEPASALALAGRSLWVAAGERLAGFDLADPAAPRPAGTLTLPGAVRALAMRGTYAYVAGDDGGLRAIDLADPAAPRQTCALLRAASGAGLAAERVAVAGDLLCVASGNTLRVFSLADPAQPGEVATWQAAGGIRALAAAGRYVYYHCGSGCCGGPPEEFQILDLADARQPRLAARLALSGRGQAELTIAGAHAYLLVDGRLDVLDVGDVAAPRLAGRLPVPGSAVGGVLAVAGRYAYLSADGGLVAVDVSDPADPRAAGVGQGIAAGEDAPAGDRHTAGALALAGRLACVTLWKGGSLAVARDGLAVLDLADPAQPRQLGRLLQPNDIADVATDGRYAYLAGGPGLVVADLADPSRPRQVGYVSAPYPASHVALVGGYAYLTGGHATDAGQQAALWVIDVADPAQPRIAGQVELAVGITDLAIVGGHACLMTMEHRGDWETGTTTYALQTVDLADPTRPRLTGALPMPEGNAGGPLPDQTLAVAADGTRAYVATGGQLLVVDVSDPDAPQIAGAGALPGGVGTLLVAGGHAYATTWDAGLLIYRLGQGAPYTPPSPAPAATLQPATQALDCAALAAQAPVAHEATLVGLSAGAPLPTPPEATGTYCVLWDASLRYGSCAEAAGVPLWRYSGLWQQLAPQASWPAWLDGRDPIYFLGGGQLFAADAQTGKATATGVAVGPGPGAQAMSRPLFDGSLLTVEEGGRLTIRNAGPQSPTWLAGIAIGSALDRLYPSPYRANALAIVSASGATIEVYRPRQASVALQLNCALAQGQAPAWSADGTRLAFVAAAARATILVYDTRTGSTRAILQAEAPGERLAGLTWLGGGLLAFTRQAEGEAPAVWLVAADGGRVQRLLAAAQGPTWAPADPYSPSCRVPRSLGRLVYRSAGEGAQEWRVACVEAVDGQ